jgi:RNA polymerase sigma factor (sigma-70 family)
MPAPVPPDLAEGLTLLITRFSDDRLGLRLTPEEVHATAWVAVQAALDRGSAPGDVPALLDTAERAIRDAIPARHDGLAWRYARRQRDRLRGLELDDLVQEGRIGLIEAARRYDPDHRVAGRPVRFSSYAKHWIQLGLRDALRTATHPIRWPGWVYRRWSQIERNRIAPGDLTTEQQQCLRQAEEAQVFSESDVPEVAGFRVQEIAIVDPEPDVVPARALPVHLPDLIAQLPALDQAILTYRYGLDGSEPATFATIGAALGYSVGYTWTLARVAERKLRGLMSKQGLTCDDFRSE